MVYKYAELLTVMMWYCIPLACALGQRTLWEGAVSLVPRPCFCFCTFAKIPEVTASHFPQRGCVRGHHDGCHWPQHSLACTLVVELTNHLQNLMVNQLVGSNEAHYRALASVSYTLPLHPASKELWVWAGSKCSLHCPRPIKWVLNGFYLQIHQSNKKGWSLGTRLCQPCYKNAYSPKLVDGKQKEMKYHNK